MKTYTQLVKRFIATLLFSALVLVFPNSSAADSFDDGSHAMTAGEYAYATGDFKKAFEIFKSLAEQGDTSAQLDLVGMYFYGEGVPQDYEEGVKWLRKAAEQGDSEAQHELGFLYQVGRVVPKDYSEAVKWFRKAAEQGYRMSQLQLGVMYELGLGVRRDFIEAHKWKKLSAASTSTSLKHSKPGDDLHLIEKKMTPSQIAEAQKLAREWKPKPNK